MLCIYFHKKLSYWGLFFFFFCLHILILETNTVEFTHKLLQLYAKINQALSSYLLCFWKQFRDDSLTKLVVIHVSCLQWVISVMKPFQLWSVEIFCPGFYHVHLVLNWYFHWGWVTRKQEKEGKEKKNQKSYWNSSLFTPFSLFKI